jgi:hypothetical protein
MIPVLAVSDAVHSTLATERIGHRKVGVTFDLCGHILPGTQQDAAARVDAALQAAINRRTKSVG